jgi:hypothetical protein
LYYIYNDSGSYHNYEGIIFMDTVLTLNIDRNVAESAAVYAKRTRKTVSQLVEEYLSSISEDYETGGKPLGPVTSRLAGIIKLDSDVDHKELLASALMEKYL